MLLSGYTVLAEWPGSVHDSRIFKSSSLFARLSSGNLQGILLGDNGYGLYPFLLTPYLRPNNDVQENFNVIHKRTRNAIERAFGQLKRRFHCLGSILRVRLDRVCSVIVASFILHNLAKRYRDPDFDLEDGFPFQDDNDAGEPVGDVADGYYRNLGNIKRDEIANMLVGH